MTGQTLIENGVSPGLGRSVFESAGDVGGEVGRLVEAALGALCDEGWRGRGRMFENLREWECASVWRCRRRGHGETLGLAPS